MAKLLQSLIQLFRNWWRGDRVRVSCLTGQLWQMQPGSLLTIQGEDMEVLNRVQVSEPETAILFECRGEHHSGRLQVIPTSMKPHQKIYWETNESRTELLSTDVQIWR